MDEPSSSIFWVDKSTGTFADLLLAYGFAELLHHATGGDVRIHDQGPVLHLEAQQAFDAASLPRLAGRDLLPWLETPRTPAPGGLPAVNYDQARDIERAWFAARRARPAGSAAGAAADPPGGLPAPDPDLPLYKLVKQMGALTVYNGVVQRWHADQAHWPVYLRLLAHLFGQRPNDVAAAEAAWKAYARGAGVRGSGRVTAVQILNPAMGRGGMAVKANSATPNNKDSFWLIEYLKFLGARVSAVPLTVRGAKDRKTYVPLPVHLSLRAHRRVQAAWRAQLPASTAVKLDVLAGLAYTRTFIEQWRAGHLTACDLRSSEPADFVAGLAVAFYKDMGHAHTLLSLAQINVPVWMRLATAADAAGYLDLLAEHTAIVQGLDETHSDEQQLLRQYRDFLSGHEVDRFYDFAAGYAPVLMRRLVGGQPAHQFTTTNLEMVLLGHADQAPHLGESVRNPGFRNLATAIRLSTVVPQRQKVRQQRPLYEVRYGLGAELQRKAAYKELLVQALGEFVRRYGQETRQVRARTGLQRRPRVTEADLAQVVNLMDHYGATMVGSLLLAYGYARTGQFPAARRRLPVGTPPGADPESVPGLPDTPVAACATTA